METKILFYAVFLFYLKKFHGKTAGRYGVPERTGDV